MAERAECVMLNKGPYITRAVSALDRILRRMQEHQSKKKARLRSLTLTEDA
jgi:pyruvate kinase